MLNHMVRYFLLFSFYFPFLSFFLLSFLFSSPLLFLFFFLLSMPLSLLFLFFDKICHGFHFKILSYATFMYIIPRYKNLFYN